MTMVVQGFTGSSEVGTADSIHHVGTLSVFLQTLIHQILTRVCDKLGTALGPLLDMLGTHTAHGQLHLQLSLCSATPTSSYSLPLTLLPEGGAAQWVRTPARDRQEASSRGRKGEGDLRLQVKPWEATCHPGFSLPQKRERRDAHCSSGASLVSSALGKAWRGLDSECWPVPTSSAVSPGCPGKPLFPGTPCSKEETQVSVLLPLAFRAPCFIPTIRLPLPLILQS